MFKYLKSLLGGGKGKRAKPIATKKPVRSLTGYEEFTVPDNFLWNHVIPIGLGLMFTITCGIIYLFIALAFVGKI